MTERSPFFWLLLALSVSLVSSSALIRTAKTTSITEVNITLPVDHFTKTDTRVFNNRYWYNDKYYKRGGPVVIFDLGEAGVTPDTVAAAIGGSDDIYSPVLEIAKSHSGLALVWEHRYYGASQPCPVNDKYVANVDPRCSYQYLTVDQALEDVVYTSKHPNFPGYSQAELDALSSGKTPWIFVGGSYAGARAAWIRVRSPEAIYASWSSSATVAPLVDGSSYFNTQARTLPSNCSADVNAALQYIDSVLGGNDNASVSDMQIRLATTNNAINSGFNVNTSSQADANSLSKSDLVSGLIRAYLGDFQYDGPSSKFCDHLESFNIKSSPETADIHTVLQNGGDGVASDKGLIGSGNSARSVANAYMWACVAQKQPILGSNSSSTAAENVKDNMFKNIEPADSSADFNFGWTVVTETGGFQSWSPEYAELQKGKVVLSRFADQATLRDGYISSFAGVNTSLIPATPRVDHVLKYGGWNMTPSNVMFTVGEYDPWRPFTVLGVDQEIGAPLRTATKDVPKCDVAPAQSEVFGLVYPNAAHVSDGTISQSALEPDSPPAVGFDLFHAALKEWLPCFGT
ncbi:hypothetical protein M409DRAFT_27411 [Zasmidium cellare ATCC 36951]|uniref:Uncharacterized protein n=1 Tax=Zasmidium cellare ATCC 36951 TaxID=1080233 RepID=A0A6A6C4S8_ZASCE|nr:uncharacterized protein M409DRAFT_27411 [Zasmidium cellare ATCC 36951]KAF2162031.1 hypothetical protein M409DRAFT_27411 [Zasmidium cellare ATCC 36951]